MAVYLQTIDANRAISGRQSGLERLLWVNTLLWRDVRATERKICKELNRAIIGTRQISM